MGRFRARIETSANQAYIFASQRLRDAVGASYLIDELGRYAAQRATVDADAASGFAGRSGRVAVQAAGFVEASFDLPGQAEDWIREVTLRAWRTAPGLDVTGAVVDATDPQGDVGLSLVLALETERMWRRGPVHDVGGSPWVRRCDYTGQAALDVANAIPGERRRGRVLGALVAHTRAASTRSEAKGRIKSRLAAELRAMGSSRVHLADSVDRAVGLLDPDDDAPSALSWRAVVHADGNNLGQLFLHLATVAAGPDARLLGDVTIGAVSKAVDVAAWGALADAIVALADAGASGPGDALPVYPLIVGGDDLTVIVDGRYALLFAASYLRSFEARTAASEVISKAVGVVAMRHGDGLYRGGLTACAGVAITKVQFPFSLAHDLAAACCRSAKDDVRRGGGPASALDWHVVLDASPEDLEASRRHASVRRAPQQGGVDGDTQFTRKPYRVGHTAGGGRPLEGLVESAQAIRRHRQGATATAPVGRPLPPLGVLHDLRHALPLGADAADRRLRLALAAHEGLSDLLPAISGRPSLPPQGATLFDVDHRTGLLDLLEGADFLRGFPGEVDVVDAARGEGGAS